MNTTNSLRTLASLLVSASLVACATPANDDEHGEHHGARQAAPAATTPAGGSGMMGGSQSGMGMMGGSMMSGAMDRAQAKPAGAGGPNAETMCSVYQKMQQAQTEQERQQIIAQHMQGMTPEMRQQHLDMMRQGCSR